jgi:Zn-dependent protease/CBS domain-containing protein
MEGWTMKWSFKLARIAGIDVNVHMTFLLLVGFVAVSYWLQGGGLPAVVEGVLFLLVLFLCVLLHEFGHALTARRFGIQTRDITLLPIGGVARLERMPEQPLQELWVALAGPAVNLVIAAILFVGLLVTRTFEPMTSLSLTSGNFAERILAVNLSLLLFNLVPAFPMDGGRAVRALLATRMEYTRATHIAALLGQGLALVFGFLGLFGNPSLLFIAFFVWIGAGQEASMVQVKSALSGIPVSRAMLTEFHTLEPTDPLSKAVELVLRSSQHDFPVAADGRVVGILTREGLIKALSENKDTIFVSYVMEKEFAVIDSSQMLDDVSQHIQASSQQIVPVVHNGLLVGLFTLENVGELLMIQNAVRQRKQVHSIP